MNKVTYPKPGNSCCLLQTLFVFGRIGTEYNRKLTDTQNKGTNVPLETPGWIKRGRQRQRREGRKIFLRNPRILLSISLLWFYVSIFA